MRLAALWLVVLALARAQEPAILRDPASLFPRGTSIYFELDNPSAAADLMRNASLLSTIDARERAKAEAILADLVAVDAKRAAIAVLPAIILSTRWIVLAETADGARLLEKMAKYAGDRAWKPATAEIPPWFVVADAPDTIEVVMGLRDGKAPPLSDRDDFKRFRARMPAGVLRWHVDVAKLAPSAARYALSKRGDVGAVLFGYHLKHVAKTARTFSGAFDMNRGMGLVATAEIEPMAAAQAFTETRPTQPVLLPPEGCALRLSLPRDLAQFWNGRGRLLSDEAEAPLAEFQNNLGILMGGLTVEDLFAGLGSAFDLYVARGNPAAEPGHRYPSAAIVAVVNDASLKTELLLSFQTTIGIVNAQRTADGLPRLFQESTNHRDVAIASARILPGSVPDAADDRLQPEWSFAIAKDRLILGSHRPLVTALVDRALDGRTTPRATGDEAELFGVDAAALLVDSSALTRARLMIGEGESKEAAHKMVDAFVTFFSTIEKGNARLDLAGDLATLDVRLDAPRMYRKAAESR
jgi:hypothetical protein